jgi:hypothetical protein
LVKPTCPGEDRPARPRNVTARRHYKDFIVAASKAYGDAVLSEEFGVGIVWTWVAIDADTKLCCSWMVGDRGAQSAFEFMKDLAGRLANRIQLTTDGHNVYVNAVEAAFGSKIDYAMLVKIYGADRPKKHTTAPQNSSAAVR